MLYFVKLLEEEVREREVVFFENPYDSYKGELSQFVKIFIFGLSKKEGGELTDYLLYYVVDMGEDYFFGRYFYFRRIFGSLEEAKNSIEDFSFCYEEELETNILEKATTGEVMNIEFETLFE